MSSRGAGELAYLIVVVLLLVVFAVGGWFVLRGRAERAAAERAAAAKALKAEHDMNVLSARSFLRSKDFENARKSVQKALDALPESEQATALLAQIKKAEEAARAAELERARAQAVHDTAVETARAFLEAGELDSARTSVERALKVLPDSKTARGLMARIVAAEEKRAEEAAKAKAEHDAAIRSARSFLDAGDFENARRSANDALDVLPESHQAKDLLAEIDAAERKRAEEAARAKAEHDAAIRSARSFLDTGDFKNARKFANEALKALPESSQAKALMVQIDAAEAAQKEREEERRRLAAEKKRGELLAKLAKVEAFLQAGDVDAAIAALQEAAKIDRNAPEFLAAAEKVRLAAEREGLAAETVPGPEDEQEARIEESRRFANLAAVYLSLDHTEGAVYFARRAIKLNPENEAADRILDKIGKASLNPTE